MNTNTEFGLHDILAVEDDPAILDFRCRESGYLVWPMIRMQYLRFILSDLLYDQPLVEMSRRQPYGVALRTLCRAVTYNAARRKLVASPVMLMGTGLGNYLKEGNWFNRLTDHFVSAFPNTFTVEDFFEWRWPFPRYNERVLFHAPIQVKAAVSGKLLVRDHHVAASAKLIGLVNARAKRYLDWEPGELRTSYLTNSLARYSASIPVKRAAYQRLLSRSGVQVLIKEEGCYGPSSVLLATAREIGIVTAEYQHGSISAGNDAYNLAPALLQSADYRNTLPEYFLGYGRWWNQQINVPVVKLAVGNPHRSEQILNLSEASDGEKSDVLILGDGIETAYYLDFARSLAKRIRNGRKIVFRPHPLERGRVTANASAVTDAGVSIDDNPDIYQSFRKATAVISEVSTGLFEAIGLADRVFMLDTPKSRFCYPEHPFETIGSADELVERLRAVPTEGGGTVDPEDIWASDWRRNYLEFLQRVQQHRRVPITA